MSDGTSEVLFILERNLSVREVFHLINCRFGVHGIFVLKWSLHGTKFSVFIILPFSIGCMRRS